MNKRERVLAALAGKDLDRVPSGFWLHFPHGYEKGDAAVNIHKDYFKKTGIDLFKVMNENLLVDDPSITKASDWSHIKPFNKNDPGIQNQIELVKRLADALNGEAVMLATIHGVVASISHVLGGGSLFDSNKGKGKLVQVAHLRENQSGMKAGFEAVTEILTYLTEECLKAGADGIYYAALGGETYTYTDDEFMEYIKPADFQILKAAEGRTCFNVLHMCKDSLNLKRYIGYPGEVINWGIYEHNPSLIEGRNILGDKVILGGIDDRAGVLVSGTEDDIREAVFSVLDTVGTHRFILGADCTLPTEIDYSRISCAVEATGMYMTRAKGLHLNNKRF